MDFESVERALVLELKKLSGLGSVEPYAGQLEAEVEGMALRFPAAFVLYGGSAFRELDGLNHEEEALFSVLVAARARRGTGQKAGAYAALKAVLGALANNALGLPMERLTPVRSSLLSATGGIVIYALEFKTSYDREFPLA